MTGADRNWKEFMEKVDRLLEPKNFNIQAVLRFLGEELGGVWVAYWTLDKRDGQLVFVDAWKSSSLQAERFEADVRVRKFSLGEGMPGRTWRQGTPQKSVDIVKDMMLPRSLEAYGSGLREGIWFPVKKDNSICGVIEILRDKSGPNGTQHIPMLEKLGKRLGNYLGEKS